MVPGLAELFVIGLAAHRLWATWVGGEIARSLKARLVARGGMIGYLAECPFCVSAWAGAAATGLWLVGPAGQLVDVALAAGVVVALWQSLASLVEALAVRQHAHVKIMQAQLQQLTRSQPQQREVKQ